MVAKPDLGSGAFVRMGSSPFARTSFRDWGVLLGLFFLRLREEFWKTLRASRFRTPLSLRDISRGRTETSVAVSVARTFFRDRGVFPGLFFVPAGVVWRNAPSKSYESAVGGAAVGGMAAHGLVNGMSGVSPTGMSEANLPRPHLRRARYRP